MRSSLPSHERPLRWAALILAACFFAASSAQAADPDPSMTSSTAEARFNEGLALLRAGNFVAACPKLEESVTLDPAPGAKFRLGECYEGLGKLAAAYRMFREVEADTRVEDTVDREEQVRAKLDDLEKRLSWVVVRAPEAVRKLEGFSVSQDGVPLSSEDLRAVRVPVDAGTHRFVVAATGYASVERTLTTTLTSPTTLEVPVLEKLPETKVTEPPVVVPPPLRVAPEQSPSITTGRVVSLVLFGASVAALAPGIGLGVVALSNWDDALARCEDGSRTRCPQEAIDAGNAAYDLGVVSTALFIGAGALAAGGLVMWIAFPNEVKAEVGLQPSALGSGAVVTLRGGF
jgi:hypothetical protein